MLSEFQNNRRVKLMSTADAFASKAADLEAQAKGITGMIPMGQPVLVGHHSEGRHRRDIRRVTKLRDLAERYRRKAERAKSKAESIGRVISSNDPDALMLLRRKLESVTTQNESSKKANRALAKSIRELGGRTAIRDFTDALSNAKGIPLYLREEMEATCKIFFYKPPRAKTFGPEIARLKVRITEMGETS